jgi:hypothetical protein
MGITPTKVNMEQNKEIAEKRKFDIGFRRAIKDFSFSSILQPSALPLRPIFNSSNRSVIQAIHLSVSCECKNTSSKNDLM